jgi:hypothetical protein
LNKGCLDVGPGDLRRRIWFSLSWCTSVRLMERHIFSQCRPSYFVQRGWVVGIRAYCTFKVAGHQSRLVVLEYPKAPLVASHSLFHPTSINNFDFRPQTRARIFDLRCKHHGGHNAPNPTHLLWLHRTLPCVSMHFMTADPTIGQFQLPYLDRLISIT